MDELVVIGYPDEMTALRAFDTTIGLQRELIAHLPPIALWRGTL